MKTFESPSRRLVMRLSLVVILMDDFTGTPINGSNARVWIEGEKPPIKKLDGRNVFTDLPAGDYMIYAEGGFYLRSCAVCTIKDKGMETVTLRLLPNAQYPVPPDALRIEGVTEPSARVTLYSPDKSAAYKLLADAKKGDTVVGIYHPSIINIEGQTFKIENSDGKGEYIRVKSVSDGERSEYLLTDKLKAAYPKIGTIIVPTAQTEADGNGKFTVLVKSGFTGGTKLVCETMGKKKKSRTIELDGSKYIKADMLK